MKLPAWVEKTIVGSLIAAGIAGGIAWAQNLSTASGEHGKDIAVLKNEQTTARRDITEIKVGQQRIEDKLDRLIERR